MKRLPRNLVRTGALLSVLFVVLAVAGTGPRGADADEASFDAYADKVLVNKYGGIQVEGWWDCTEAVEQAYPEEADRPDSVLVNINWDATQYVGRTKVVQVSYDSGIAGECYKKDEAGPYRWSTFSDYPMGQPMWMYSPDGKFGSGKVHIDVEGVGGWAVYYDADPLPFRYEGGLYSFTQADLKAVRVK
jgi:hypothetical protein